MQDEQGFEGAATLDELDAGLEASLRACHHMVAEYRAMLIAASGECSQADGDSESG